MKTLVIIPTYNEAQSLEITVAKLLETVPNVDVLIVDDGSPDGTATLAKKLVLDQPRVSLLERSSKQGLGPAYLAGFNYGFENSYQFIVEMDADGSHRSEDLLAMLQQANHFDLVIGSRWIKGGGVRNWSLARQLISRFGNSYAKFMLGTKISDMTSGFRVYRADFLKQLVSKEVASAGYSFQVELAYRASQLGSVSEVPITFVERNLGKSKMTLAIVLEALTRVTFWGLKRVFS
jgi:dolichol-phosphate mannosyltransferase